jgi:hypothetical protein
MALIAGAAPLKSKSKVSSSGGIDYEDATIRVAGVHTVDSGWFLL